MANYTLAGWNGPLLVPDTSGLTYAYRAFGEGGFPLEAMQAALPGYAVSRADFRTVDEFYYFWGLHIRVSPGVEVAVLFPGFRVERSVTVYVRGEIVTQILQFILTSVQTCLEKLTLVATPPQPVVEINIRGKVTR